MKKFICIKHADVFGFDLVDEMVVVLDLAPREFGFFADSIGAPDFIFFRRGEIELKVF